MNGSHSKPHEHEFHVIREVMRTHQAVLAAFTNCVGMPASRLTLIRLLAVGDSKELGVMEIARQLGVNAAAVTRQVQEMEKEGLIVRRPDRKDKRRIYIKLSRKGRSLFERLHDRNHRFERSLVSKIAPEELRIAAEVLATIREALNAMR
jgi:DNA-binding MarR family transcriptional regulator